MHEILVTGLEANIDVQVIRIVIQLIQTMIYQNRIQVFHDNGF